MTFMQPEDQGLRFATESDASAIVALVNLAFVVERQFKRTDRTDEREVGERLRKGRFLLLEEERTLLASIYVELRGSVGYLGMLAVSPSRQSLGLGERMMAAAEEVCRASGCVKAELTVLDRRTELPPFYEKLGYRVAGTAPWPHGAKHFDMRRDLIVMRKLLGQTE